MIFQSTRPIRGATAVRTAGCACIPHFNPRAPYGARHGQQLVTPVTVGISIHAPHTGRDFVLPGGDSPEPISIHAPHTGRDRTPSPSAPRARSISIHAPHTGRDLWWVRGDGYTREFQSTRPIRGATESAGPGSGRQRISIHAPHTGRDQLVGHNYTSLLPFQSTRPIRGATMATPACFSPV